MATPKGFLGVRSEGRWWTRACGGRALASASRMAMEVTSVVSRHVGDSYGDGQLGWEATLAESATVPRDTGLSVLRQLEDLNLDVSTSSLAEPSA